METNERLLLVGVKEEVNEEEARRANWGRAPDFPKNMGNAIHHRPHTMTRPRIRGTDLMWPSVCQKRRVGVRARLWWNECFHWPGCKSNYIKQGSFRTRCRCRHLSNNQWRPSALCREIPDLTQSHLFSKNIPMRGKQPFLAVSIKKPSVLVAEVIDT